MKECVYGWYPPAGNRWTTTNQKLHSYDKECLYKHKKSRYYAAAPKSPQPEKAPDPLASMEIRGTSAFANSPAPPSEDRGPSRTASARSFSAHRPPNTAKKAWGTSQTQITPKPPPPRLDISLGSIPRPFDDGVIGSAKDGWTFRPTWSSMGVRATFTPGRTNERAKSAYTYRPKSQHPKRPVHSAGPVRPNDVAAMEAAAATTAVVKAPVEIPTASKEAPPVGDAGTRAAAASPAAGAAGDAATAPAPAATPAPASDDGDGSLPDVPEDDEESVADGAAVDATETSAPITDYETVLKTYGWRAEIPGDPFNLKRPCLQKRLPYTMTMATPQIPPNPPRGHMQNYDTFFSNTIPRKPLSFSIHKEWISEVLHAKRMALQKREEAEGITYKHTNYSFIY